MLDDLRASDVLPSIAHEEFQQCEFLWRQFDVVAAAFHRVFHATQFEVLDAQHIRILAAPTEERPHTSRELRKRKWLEDEIVGALIEHLNALHGPRAIRQNQD